MSGWAKPCGDVTPEAARASLAHRPEPTLYHANGRAMLRLVCRFCDQPIQRRGFRRRWRHVQ